MSVVVNTLGEMLSANFCMHELTGTHDWLVSLWLIDEGVCLPSLPDSMDNFGLLDPWLAAALSRFNSNRIFLIQIIIKIMGYTPCLLDSLTLHIVHNEMLDETLSVLNSRNVKTRSFISMHAENHILKRRLSTDRYGESVSTDIMCVKRTHAFINFAYMVISKHWTDTQTRHRHVGNTGPGSVSYTSLG